MLRLSFVWCFRHKFFSFRVSSVGVMVGLMLMVLVGIMVFQSMLMLVEGVVGSGQRFVEFKLLGQFQSDVASRRGCGKGSATVQTALDLRKMVGDPAVC